MRKNRERDGEKMSDPNEDKNKDDENVDLSPLAGDHGTPFDVFAWLAEHEERSTPIDGEMRVTYEDFPLRRFLSEEIIEQLDQPSNEPSQYSSWDQDFQDLLVDDSTESENPPDPAHPNDL